MPIDWSATGEMLSGIGTIGGAAAVLVAAVLAKNTVDSWKRQKIAERKFEHAERTLVASYNAREALAHIRSPMIHGHELHSARQQLETEAGWAGFDKAKQDRLETAQAMINRMQDTQAAFAELADCTPFAKALFGDELDKALRQLHRQRWIVRTYVDAYADGGGDPEWLVEVRSEMWQPMDSTKGKVSAAIAEAMVTIEATCLPALQA
mgnify:CR=1 FL=1